MMFTGGGFVGRSRWRDMPRCKTNRAKIWLHATLSPGDKWPTVSTISVNKTHFSLQLGACMTQCNHWSCCDLQKDCCCQTSSSFGWVQMWPFAEHLRKISLMSSGVWHTAFSDCHFQRPVLDVRQHHGIFTGAQVDLRKIEKIEENSPLEDRPEVTTWKKHPCQGGTHHCLQLPNNALDAVTGSHANEMRLADFHQRQMAKQDFAN